MEVSIGGASYLYPIGYGFARCVEHDAQVITPVARSRRDHRSQIPYYQIHCSAA
jgi:hypothetical protein